MFLIHTFQCKRVLFCHGGTFIRTRAQQRDCVFFRNLLKLRQRNFQSGHTFPELIVWGEQIFVNLFFELCGKSQIPFIRSFFHFGGTSHYVRELVLNHRNLLKLIFVKVPFIYETSNSNRILFITVCFFLGRNNVILLINI